MASEYRVHKTEQLFEKGELMIEIVTRHVWDSLESIEYVPWGYETHVSEEIRDIVTSDSFDDDPTARHIRSSPDFFVVQQKPDIIYFLECKSTVTPLWSRNRIRKLSENAGLQLPNELLRWEDIGQLQAAAYDNYIALKNFGGKVPLGMKVAVLNYVAYHERLLLCDFIEKITEIGRYKVSNKNTKGSGEDFINFDVTQMRTFEDFLIEEHGVDPDYITPRIRAACRELEEKIPVDHDEGSPLYTGLRT